MTDSVSNALVENHLYVAEVVARRMVRGMPPHVEVDDLVSAGYVGLLKAASRFDSERNIKFSTFAARRVHGEIIDHLRNLDPLSRRARQELKAKGATLFDEQLSDDHARTLPDHALRPDAVFERTQSFERVRAAVGELPERERRIILQLYFSERTHEQLQQEFGICETRVHQLKRAALSMLRNILQGSRPRPAKATIAPRPAKAELITQRRLCAYHRCCRPFSVRSVKSRQIYCSQACCTASTRWKKSHA